MQTAVGDMRGRSGEMGRRDMPVEKLKGRRMDRERGRREKEARE